MMFSDVYSKVSTPLAFAHNLSNKQYQDKLNKKPRIGKRQIVSDQDKVTYITDEYERRRIERLYFELKWQLNLCFLEGQQYNYISTATGDLIEYPKRFSYQEREVYNHILPIYTTRLAKLSRLHLNMKARPSTSDSEDVNAAYITTKLLNQWQNDSDSIDNQSQANLWMEATGTAIWKTIWNPNKGRKIAETENGFIYEGEVENIVCSPFEIFPDSSYNPTVSRCTSIIHARPVDIDYIYYNYGVDLIGKRMNVFSSGTRSTFMHDGSYGLRGRDMKMKDNVVMLYEYYEKPTKEHPNGILWIACDEHDKLLYEGELPFINSKFNNRELPFDIQRSIERPGYFWGKTIIDSLIPVQRRYNAIKNRTAEYLNRVAVGVVVVDTHTAQMNNLEEDGLQPGNIVQYEPTEGSKEPSFMQTPPLPNEFFNQENAELQNFTKLSGVSEISRDSSAPSGIESGKALTILNEQDETRLSLTARNVQNCMLNVATKTIYAYKQFVKGERLIRIVGKSDTVKLMEWTGSSLTAEDICIEGVARISETLTQKKNTVMELLQLGLFRDENGVVDTEQILQMIEFGDVNLGKDVIRLERVRSNEENILMAQGQQQVVDDFEEHSVALLAHQEYMLSTEFKMLDPQIQEIFRTHYQQHEQIQQQKQMQQMQMQQSQEQPQQGVQNITRME